MPSQRRFRKRTAHKNADVWVDVGLLGYAVELYEGGEYVSRQRGLRLWTKPTEAFVSGNDFAALVHISSNGTVRCTLSH